MKVKELLSQLQNIDPDTEVVWFDYETGSDRSAKMTHSVRQVPYFDDDPNKQLVVRFELEDKKTY